MMYIILVCVMLITFSIVWIAISIHRYITQPNLIRTTKQRHKGFNNANDNIALYNAPEPDLDEINKKLDARRVNESSSESVEAHVDGLGDELEAEAIDIVSAARKLKGVIR